MTEPNYLEHYGVLGMKWGVRKDEERSLTKKKTKPAVTYATVPATGYISNQHLKAAYSIFEATAQKKAKTIMENANALASVFNNNSINDFTGEKGDAMWNQAYTAAAKELNLSEEQAFYLAVYSKMLELGIENDFHLVVGDKDGKPYYMLMHKDTGQKFDNIYTARTYMKTVMRRQREKNVSDQKPVSIKKGAKVSGGKAAPGVSPGAMDEKLSSVLKEAKVKQLAATMDEIMKNPFGKK